MEIDAEDGSTKIALKRSSKAVFGRGHGFNTTDKTISREHLLFQTDNQRHPRVTFQVLGKNPIWIKDGRTGEMKVFRKSEHGEVAAGDWFCVSGKNPVWFNVKEVGESDESDTEVRGSGGFDADVDVFSIDPVKEFGFLVIGHEFDHYPKKMLRKVKDWDWFLEEPSKNSDEDEDEDGKQKGQRGHRGRKKKRKHGGGDEDEEWTGESEEEKEDSTNMRKIQKTKYNTRSKDTKKAFKQSRDAGKSINKRMARVKDEDEEEEEEEEDDDETLGGFIVTDEEAELEENDDEEEEEFIDDEEEEEFIDDEEDD